MYHRLYYHVVWTTRDRKPQITAPVAAFLCRFLRGVARAQNVRVLNVGIVTTHVHLLVAGPVRLDWPRLMQRLKGASAHTANRAGLLPTNSPLQWAKGYSVQTVSPRAVPAARRYIERQPEHHPDERIPDWEGDAEHEPEMRSL